MGTGRDLIYRAMGVPAAVVAKDGAVGWKLAVHFKQTKRERADAIVGAIRTAAVPALLNLLDEAVDTGKLDDLILEVDGVHLSTTVEDEATWLANKTWQATQDSRVFRPSDGLGGDVWQAMVVHLLNKLIEEARKVITGEAGLQP